VIGTKEVYKICRLLLRPPSSLSLLIKLPDNSLRAVQTRITPRFLLQKPAHRPGSQRAATHDHFTTRNLPSQTHTTQSGKPTPSYSLTQIPSGHLRRPSFNPLKPQPRASTLQFDEKAFSTAQVSSPFRLASLTTSPPNPDSHTRSHRSHTFHTGGLDSQKIQRLRFRDGGIGRDRPAPGTDVASTDDQVPKPDSSIRNPAYEFLGLRIRGERGWNTLRVNH